jgi:hypothetical protein
LQQPSGFIALWCVETFAAGSGDRPSTSISRFRYLTRVSINGAQTSAPSSSIARDHKTYRAANRSKLEEYMDKFAMPAATAAK